MNYNPLGYFGFNAVTDILVNVVILKN
jgi:hypothetical protein